MSERNLFKWEWQLRIEELEEHNAKLVADLAQCTDANTELFHAFAEAKDHDAKLVAALKEARKRLIGCGTHGIYAGVLTQIDEALGRQ